ncbi:MAG: flagellin [Bacillota bacterium]|jgi:flagellin
MRIYNNISAMTAYNTMQRTDGSISKNMERLATGLRINSAADDATGFVIAEQMRNQVTGFNQSIKNAQQGMSMLKTAEGAMGQQNDLLNRIRELVVSSNSGNMTADNLATIQGEITELVGQINDIATNTEYNGKKLLDGSLGTKLEINTNPATSDLLGVAGVSKATITGTTKAGDYTIDVDATKKLITMKNSDNSKTQTITTADTKYSGTLNFDVFGISIDVNIGDNETMKGKKLAIAESSDGKVDFQVGANDGQKLTVGISNLTAAKLGTTKALNLVDVKAGTAGFTNNLKAVDEAIKQVSDERAKMGFYINRFQASVNNLNVSKENLQASESLIRDLDMADEMVSLTRNQILSQASTAMLAQANQRPQAILQLLR